MFVPDILRRLRPNPANPTDPMPSNMAVDGTLVTVFIELLPSASTQAG